MQEREDGILSRGVRLTATVRFPQLRVLGRRMSAAIAGENLNLVVLKPDHKSDGDPCTDYVLMGHFVGEDPKLVGTLAIKKEMLEEAILSGKRIRGYKFEVQEGELIEPVGQRGAEKISDTAIGRISKVVKKVKDRVHLGP